MENESQNLNRNYMKELIELRQLKSERESVLRTNQYYIAQVSQMEIKISELKASIQAKDKEISYLNEKLIEIEEKAVNNPKFQQSTDQELYFLHAENEHLKQQLIEAGEVSQLKIQLEHAVKMKETFEEKYREAKTQLLTNITKSQDTTNDMEYPKKDPNLKLLEELEVVKKQLEQYQNQCSLLTAENEELLKKLDTDGKDTSSVKEKTVKKDKFGFHKSVTSPEPFKLILSTSSTSYSEQPKIQSKNGEVYSTKSSGLAKIPKFHSLNSSKVSKTSVYSTSKQANKGEIVEYCPSFMRNKKNIDLKTTPTPNMKKFETNSFADDFPEEDEL